MVYRYVAQVGQPTYASAQRASLEIDRSGILTELVIRCQYTVTNGATAPVSPFFKALSRILRNVDVIVNGRDRFFSLPGEQIEARTTYEQGIRPRGTGDTVVLTASAATAYDAYVPVDFTLPRSAAPLACALPAERLGQVTLSLDFMNSDCSAFYTTPNSAVASAVTITVEGKYLIGVAPQQVFNARNVDMAVVDVTATNSALGVQIDTGNGLFYRSLFLVTLKNTLAIDTMINEVTLQTGTSVFQKRKLGFIQAGNTERYIQAAQSGVYALNMEEWGRPEWWIDTRREALPADLRFVLDVTRSTGTEQIHILREAIRPYRSIVTPAG